MRTFDFVWKCGRNTDSNTEHGLDLYLVPTELDMLTFVFDFRVSHKLRFLGRADLVIAYIHFEFALLGKVPTKHHH